MTQEHKLTKKELKGPDSFQRFSAGLVAFMDANRNLLFAIAGLGAVVLAGSWFWAERQEQQAEGMEKLYFQMEKLQQRQQENPEQEVTGEMQKLLTQFAESPQKMRARLLLAEAYYENGKYDPSIQMYAEVSSLAKPGSLNHVLAQKGLAYNHEAKKDFKKAVEIYKSIIDSSANFPLFYIYMGLARSYEALNDPDNAKLILREMQTKFSSHPELETVNRKLKQLEAPA